MANWINKQVQNVTSAAGKMAGDAVASVGNGAAAGGRNLGNNINGATLGWSNAIRDYGNSLKDATKAGGSRVGTAQNPLGLAKSQTSVKFDNQRKTQTSKQTGRDPLGINGRW